MPRSKKLSTLALAEGLPSIPTNEDRNVNTDAFSNRDLPLQYPYQNTNNECNIEKSYDLRPIPNFMSLSAHVIQDPEQFEYCKCLICTKNNVLKSCPSNWLYKNVLAETGLKFKLPFVDICKTCDEYKIKSKHSNGEEFQLLSTMNQNHKNMVDVAYRAKQEDKKNIEYNSYS
ncbi:Hypothetical protein CINCED_3A012905 [Cinara cedri]|uniref:Uncharacterized protein n=1 Tax=Cinara cedri TaxID=506608 RepID=A0A5E4M8N2_9HEMI|nr:Hypothetical protein CINCED_3A012905 [Cinara cedri]